MVNDKLVVKRVFIASPVDLQPEREIFSLIIEEINKEHAHKEGIHFEVLGWEKVLPDKGRPQELINKLLSISDIFIMLLWKRWGTPSGRFSSGTEEEFYVAKNLNIESSKPDMWLFFKKIGQIEEDSIDDCKKVIDFRKQIEENKDFLYKSFDTTDEWNNIIRVILRNWLGSEKTEPKILDKIIQLELPITQRLYIEITYLDRFQGYSKDEIYFTITDNQSLNEWKLLSDEDKKRLLYYYLSQYLYLNLGVSKYKAVMRFRIQENKYLVLGFIAFSYGASYEESTFYLPPDYHQVITSMEKEKTVLDLFAGL